MFGESETLDRVCAEGEARNGAGAEGDIPQECARTMRGRIALSAVGAAAVIAGLVAVLAGRRHQFVHALHTAPLSLLLIAVVLQVVALLARTEAWHIVVQAAGGTVSRRLLFRAAGVGYLASVLNGSVGMAARIASLRRVAPLQTPRVSALVAAEIPIISVEVALAAIFSFTLVAPLHVAWWIPGLAVLVVGSAVAMLYRTARARQTGVWTGLAILRTRGHGRGRMVAFVLTAVVAQVARNWLMLRAIGIDVSIFDAMALLIAMFTLGQLPIGPSIGPAAAVLILGSNGVAAAAAAGVLLAVTGTVGSLCYAAWAIADRLLTGRRAPVVVAAAPTPT